MSNQPEKLKSAEEWVELIWDAGNHLSSEHLHDQELPAIVKQIQLNAYKAGMTEAAEICDKYADYDSTRDSRPITKEILSARDKKGEL